MFIQNEDEPMESQLYALSDFAQGMGASYYQYDAVNLQKTTIDVDSNLRQWTYQYCTEFGFFQTPNPKYPMRSQRLDEHYWLDYCQRIFGRDLPPPHVDATNARYGGLNITGENIYFANAIEDPWQWAGMREI